MEKVSWASIQCFLSWQASHPCFEWKSFLSTQNQDVLWPPKGHLLSLIWIPSLKLSSPPKAWNRLQSIFFVSIRSSMMTWKSEWSRVRFSSIKVLPIFFLMKACSTVIPVFSFLVQIYFMNFLQNLQLKLPLTLSHFVNCSYIWMSHMCQFAELWLHLRQLLGQSKRDK